MQIRQPRRYDVKGLLFAATIGIAGIAHATPLDPTSFASLGTLNVASGSITINTDTLGITGAATFNGGTISQGGSNPQVAVFTFGSFNIGAGVTINVTGSRPLALLSQGAMSIASAISLNGGNATVPTAGAAGAAGGYVGGTGGFTGSAGGGLGGGSGSGGSRDSGGGGYGGAGGSGDTSTTPGISYGDLLTLLQGGSGGGGAEENVDGNAGGGGGGGGAIELGAVGSLSLTSSLASNGGSGAAGLRDGGAGAGGGILLHAGTIAFTSLAATGANSPAFGGAGGGGRIALVGGNLTGAQIASLATSVNAGTGFGPGQTAGVLTFRPDLATVQSAQSLNVGITPGQTGRTDPRIETLPKSLTVQSGGSATLVSPISWASGGVVSLAGGTLNINNSSTFTTGSTLNFSAGSLIVGNGQTLAFDGGVGSVTAGGSGLSDGATLRITHNGHFDSSNFFDIGSSADPGAGPTGTLLVDGSGARFTAVNESLWGYNPGDFATITFSNLGAGTLSPVSIARNGGQGLVNILSGATLNFSGLIAGGALGASATININGGALNLFSPTGTAAFRQGTTVNLSGGSLTLAGNATFSGNTLLSWTAGTITVGSDKTLDFDGGMASVTISAGLSDGATLRISNGGQLISSTNFDIGSSGVAGAGPTGTLVVDGLNSSIISGGSPFTGWAPKAGDAATVTFSNQSSGTFVFGLRIAVENSTALVNLNSGATLNTASMQVGNSSAGSTATININGGALNVYSGPATLRSGVVVNYSAGTFVNSSTLMLQNDSQVLLSTGGDKVLRSNGLNVAVTSRIDLADNDMIVHLGGIPARATVRNALIIGRNGGAWTGNGITSSSAAADPSHKSLGYALASDLFGAGGGTFDGIAVAGTAVLVKYTYLGDANLDGIVDIKDLMALALHFNTSAQNWPTGDFNYDGNVNVQDLTVLARDWQAGVGAPLGPSLQAALIDLGLPPSSIPEPAGLSLIALAAWLGLRRRALSTTPLAQASD